MIMMCVVVLFLFFFSWSLELVRGRNRNYGTVLAREVESGILLILFMKIDRLSVFSRKKMDEIPKNCAVREADTWHV